MDHRLRVELLGPLRVLLDGAPVELRGPVRRAVLVLLALAHGRPVPVGELAEALWPDDDGPGDVRQALQTHVFRLRGQLGPAADRLRTGPGGYALDLGPDGFDLAEARALLAAARADRGAALDHLRRAHALFRGPVLPDLTDVVPIATAAEGGARLHREVVDALVGAAVDAGQAERVLGLAAGAVTADPLREPAVLALMRALAAAGQAPAALRAGREHRRLLAEQTGLDPSPALAALERTIASGAAGPLPARVAPVRPVGRLVGREAEVAALHRLLATRRLVTVTGPGGVGKTRLALEVAERADAATTLLLAPLAEPGAVAHALAAALDLTVARGDVVTACAAVLGDGPGLLVIDNCEHLLEPVRDLVATLLSACPRLTVLATSRERLGLAEEHVSRLAPLRLPEEGADLARAPSVAVFLDRAARVRPLAAAELPAVAEVVRRLDGMPLAIELAAGRLSAFSVADLRDRLDRALDLLAGGRASGDARHRTLRGTVEWSYRLLAHDEQRLFRHLAVFPDGVDLDDVGGTATDLGLADDPGAVLARLVDASMVDAVITPGAPARYRMLETLRAFGLDQLAATGEHAAAAARLVRRAVALAEDLSAAFLTADEPRADARLRRETGTLRAAWRLVRDPATRDDDAAAAIVSGLIDAVFQRDLVEVRGWARELGDDPAVLRHPRAAAVLGTAAYAAYADGDHDAAERLARAGLAAGGDGGDSGDSGDGGDGGDGVLFCRHALAVALLARGDHDGCVRVCLDGPDSVRHDLHGIAALATAYAGRPDEARVLHARSPVGPAPSLRAWDAYYRGEIESVAGRSAVAEEHYERAIALGRSAGATFVVGVATVGLLSVRRAAGRVHEALAGYREVVDDFARTGNWTHLWATLRDLADLLRELGDDGTAAVLDAAADAAPDAPAVDRPLRRTDAPPPGRAEVLDLARRAIAGRLSPP